MSERVSFRKRGRKPPFLFSEPLVITKSLHKFQKLSKLVA